MEVHPLKLAREAIEGLGGFLARAAGLSDPDSNAVLSEAEEELIFTSRSPRKRSSDLPNEQA